MVEVVDIVFQMCIQREPNNFSEKVYNQASGVVKNYFENNFVTALKEKQSQTDIAFLTEFAKRWKQANITAQGINRIFNYLNRYHVPNSDGLLELSENSFNLFKKVIFNQFSKALQ